MRSRSVFLAMLVVSVMGAMSPQAVAATPEVDLVSGSFPVPALALFSGGNLSVANGVTVSCVNGTGSGQLTSSTTAEGSVSFGGCQLAGLGAKCTTDGQPTGTIKLEPLTVHLVYLDEDHTKPGALLTPPASGRFTQFKCFGINVEVTGNGVLAQVTSPGCGATASSTTAQAQATAHGTQKYLQVEETGTAYDLKATIGAEAPETAAISGGITFVAEREGTLTCPEQK